VGRLEEASLSGTLRGLENSRERRFGHLREYDKRRARKEGAGGTKSGPEKEGTISILETDMNPRVILREREGDT